MSRIVLQQLVKEHPGRKGRPVRALDRVSLDLPEGGFLAVLGPSGSGKTSLLRLIAGLDLPTAGIVALGGRDMAGVGPEDREVAMVFQRDALLPHLTARENILLGLRLRGVGEAELEGRLAEVSALLPLGTALDRLPRAMSGGERQRAALARALIRRPRVLLLDEPFSQIDAPARAALRRQLLEVHRRLGLTIVLVTHDQEEAMALAAGGFIAVLDRGVIRQMASPAALYAGPGHLAVAAFVGSPPMNLFRGELVAGGGGVWFHAAAAPAVAAPAVADGDGKEGGEEPPAERLSLCLTEGQGKALLGGGRSGERREVVLGLRAEHIVGVWEERSLPYGCEVEAVVEVVEFQGVNALVGWRCGGAIFQTVVPWAGVGSELRPGDRAALVFDLSAARFFEPVSGAALEVSSG